MALRLILNGEMRDFPELAEGAALAELITVLMLKSDRIAVEHNGEIAARGSWAAVRMRSGDRLEVVHFVGGGGS